MTTCSSLSECSSTLLALERQLLFIYNTCTSLNTGVCNYRPYPYPAAAELELKKALRAN